MRLLLAFTLLTLSVNLGFAQCKLSIFAETGEPLGFAHVSFEAEGVKKSYAISDVKGEALLPEALCIKTQKTFIKVSFIGFIPYQDSILASDNVSIYLKEDPVVLNQVVVTAQFSESSPEKAIQKVDIVDRKQIDLLGAQNLKDVLQHQTNIQIAQDQALGSSISMQGLSGQNVKILIDGVPVIGRLNGNVDLSQINLDQIERIEIIEGPLSVSYGTDALAGTINLISKKADPERTIGVTANTYWESVGQYNTGLNLSLSKKPHSINLNGSRNYFDGWNPSDPFIKFETTENSDSTRFKAYKPKEQLQGKINYRFDNGNMSISAYADVFEETLKNKGYPRAPYQIRAFDDIYLTKRNNLGLLYTHKLKKGYRIESSFAINNYSRTKNTYIRDLSSLQSTLSENPGDQDTTSNQQFTSRSTFSTANPLKNINYQFGYDARRETATGERILNSTPINNVAVFGSVQFNIKDKVQIQPGLRYAYNNLYQAPLIPSVNVLVGQKNLKLRMSYAKGFRAPSLKELYFNFIDINHNIVGNPDLQAETSNSYNLQLKWQKQIGIHLVNWELSSYFNDLNQLIDIAQEENSTQFQYLNIGSAQTTGAQIKAEYAIAHLKASVAFSQNGKKVSFDQAFADENKMNWASQLRSSLLFDFFSSNSSLAIFYTYNGASNNLVIDSEGSTRINEIDSYQLFDLSFNKQFLENKLQMSVGVKNLFDVFTVNSTAGGGTHSSNGGLAVSWGRSMFLKANYNF